MTTGLLQILQPTIHYSLHLLFPGLIAWIFFKKEWEKAWLIMTATMIIDLDHLYAVPIFEPTRCGIGFHPLHSTYSIAVYFLMIFIPIATARIAAVGLLFHIFTDYLDCLWIWQVNN